MQGKLFDARNIFLALTLRAGHEFMGGDRENIEQKREPRVEGSSLFAPGTGSGSLWSNNSD
jgi:hypothetical protein